MKEARIAIAVFVKTPGHSPLKTRLADTLGKETAEEFHRRSTRCLQKTLQTWMQQYQGRCQPYWSVAEESAQQHELWSAFPKAVQGEGELGERLSRVYSSLIENYEAVILIGADSPQIHDEYLNEAIKTLFNDEQVPFVLGPAVDGGFVLFGGTQPVPEEVWQSVPYSVPETAACLLKALKPLGGCHQLSSENDVDEVDDLLLLLEQLRQREHVDQLREFAGWIATLPAVKDRLGA